MAVEADRYNIGQSLNAWRSVSMSSINHLCVMNFIKDNLE